MGSLSGSLAEDPRMVRHWSLSVGVSGVGSRGEDVSGSGARACNTLWGLGFRV